MEATFSYLVVAKAWRKAVGGVILLDASGDEGTIATENAFITLPIYLIRDQHLEEPSERLPSTTASAKPFIGVFTNGRLSPKDVTRSGRAHRLSST